METTKAVKHLVADESKLHQLFPLSANEGLMLLPQFSSILPNARNYFSEN